MKKIFPTLSIIFSSIFLFSGCYDAVIQSIRREIELEDAIISGFVNSIVRFTGKGSGEGNESGKEYIFLQNGVIYYKQISEEGDETLPEAEKRLTNNASHARWLRAPNSPDGLKYNYYGEDYSGYYISKLASDEDYVYALACRPDTDDDQSRNILFPRTVFYFPDESGGWSEIPGVREALDKYVSTLDKDEYYLMNASVHLFCTNTPKKEHRRAYLRIGGGAPYYDANGSGDKYSGEANLKENYGNKEVGNYGIIELKGPDTNVEECFPEGENNAGYRTLGVVYLNGKEHFVNYVAVGSNETKEKDATWFCYGYGSSVYVFDDAAKDTGNGGNNSDASTVVTVTGLKDNVVSLCVTADSIIVGTYEEGAEHITIGLDENGVPDEKGLPATRSSSFFPNGGEDSDYYKLYKGGQLHNGSNNNATDIMCEPYIVRTLFCTDPSLGEIEIVEGKEGNKGAALYSAIQFRYTESSQSADYDNVGLWAYYTSKGNWNRE